MEQESVARLMRAEADAKRQVDDAKRGASQLIPSSPSTPFHVFLARRGFTLDLGSVAPREVVF